METEELDAFPVESYHINGEWDPSGAMSFVLAVRVKASPGAKIPILKLSDGIETHIESDCVDHADANEPDINSSPGYRPTSSSPGTNEASEILNNHVYYAGYQETPRRLYRAGMGLSPSPTKERLFPESPETNGSDLSNNNEAVVTTTPMSNVQLCAQILEPESIQESPTIQHERGISSESRHLTTPENYRPGVLTGGSRWSKKNNSPHVESGWRNRLSHHQRDVSEATIIHRTPEHRRADISQKTMYPERKAPLSRSPRTSDINISKRESRIPKKIERTSHINILIDPNLLPESALQTENANETNLACSVSPRYSAQENNSLENVKTQSTAHGKQGKEDPRQGVMSVKRSSFLERSTISQDDPFQTATPLSARSTNIPRDILINVDDGQQSNNPLHDGRSSVASWLYGKPSPGTDNGMRSNRKEGDIPQCRNLLIGGNESDGGLEWDSEQIDETDKGSPFDRRISLPSPTPSSKRSMVWNSAEAIAGMKEEFSSLLDLENIEDHPIKPPKPDIETDNGIVFMKFPDDTTSQTVVYEAHFRLRRGSARDDDCLDTCSEAETRPEYMAKWQIEYTPAQDGVWVVNCSVDTIDDDQDPALLHGPFKIGFIQLDVNREDCQHVMNDISEWNMVNMYERMGEASELLSRWFLDTLRGAGKSMESQLVGIGKPVVVVVYIHLRRFVRTAQKILLVGLLTAWAFIVCVIAVHLANFGTYDGRELALRDSSQRMGCSSNNLECQIPRHRAKLFGPLSAPGFINVPSDHSVHKAPSLDSPILYLHGNNPNHGKAEPETTAEDEVSPGSGSSQDSALSEEDGPSSVPEPALSPMAGENESRLDDRVPAESIESKGGSTRDWIDGLLGWRALLRD